MLDMFKKERYILCFDPAYTHSPKGTPMLHICLKEGHTPLDQLKAWAHASEVGRECAARTTDDPVSLIESTYQDLEFHFKSFIEHIRGLGWDVEEGALMTGAAVAVLVSAKNREGADGKEASDGDDSDGDSDDSETKKDI